MLRCGKYAGEVGICINYINKIHTLSKSNETQEERTYLICFLHLLSSLTDSRRRDIASTRQTLWAEGGGQILAIEELPSTGMTRESSLASTCPKSRWRLDLRTCHPQGFVSPRKHNSPSFNIKLQGSRKKSEASTLRRYGLRVAAKFSS